jgi:transaldolase
MWINNPSGPEMDKGIAAGAINCTTNPAYGSKLIDSDPDYIRGVIDEVIRQTDDQDAAADRVYQGASARVMARFLPLYEESQGDYGYVTMQGDPREDEDTEAIVEASLRYRKLGKNFMTKIPVIVGGLEAIEACVEEDIPVCATEVFSMAQAISICELYQRAAARTGKHPPFYVTHITGIFDEYLGKVARRDGIEIGPEVLAQAGCAVARKEYQMLKERGYETTMLGGGARGTHHFTEMVGGDVHVTINWSTAQELIEADGPLVSRIDAETPQSVIDELVEKFDDFRKAYYADALSVEEYAAYGPVQLFRNAFLKGWYLLLAEVSTRRHLHAM